VYIHSKSLLNSGPSKRQSLIENLMRPWRRDGEVDIHQASANRRLHVVAVVDRTSPMIKSATSSQRCTLVTTRGHSTDH